jgi:hypothetical protein
MQEEKGDESEEKSMNKWRLMKGLLAALNDVLDEILQFAVLARQAVPWLV